MPDSTVTGMKTSWCKAAGDRELLQETLDVVNGCDCSIQVTYWLARALKLPDLTPT